MEPSGTTDTRTREIRAHSVMVDVLLKVSLEMMKQAQKEDTNISYMVHCIKYGKKPTFTQICKIKSRNVCRYLQQFNWLAFQQGVLHKIYKQDGAKYQQLIMSVEFRTQLMGMFHDEQAHQAMEHVLVPVHEYFIGTLCSTMLQNGNMLQTVTDCQGSLH